MIREEYKYSELTSRIIKCSIAVHNYLGNGFQEVIYQRALEYEFSLENLKYQREIEKDIYYKDLQKPIGNRKIDFLVDENVLVETKAILQLEDVHLAQTINYLEAFKLEVGLLINFGGRKLQFLRLMKSEEQLNRTMIKW